MEKEIEPTHVNEYTHEPYQCKEIQSPITSTNEFDTILQTLETFLKELIQSVDYDSNNVEITKANDLVTMLENA